MILGTIYMYFINPITGYLQKKKGRETDCEYCSTSSLLIAKYILYAYISILKY